MTVLNKLCECSQDLFDMVIEVLQRQIKPPVVLPVHSQAVSLAEIMHIYYKPYKQQPKRCSTV